MLGYEPRIEKRNGSIGIGRTIYAPIGPEKANYLLVVDFDDGTPSKQREYGAWAEAVDALSSPIETLFPD